MAPYRNRRPSSRRLGRQKCLLSSRPLVTRLQPMDRSLAREAEDSTRGTVCGVGRQPMEFTFSTGSQPLGFSEDSGE